MDLKDRDLYLLDLRRRHTDFGRLMDDLESRPTIGEQDLRRVENVARDIEYTLKKLCGRNFFL